MSQLRSVLHTLEIELGIEGLSKAELDVLSAVVKIANGNESYDFSTSQVLEHPLVKHLGRSTIYRSIASLEERGFFVVSRRGYNADYRIDLSEC
jgi:predicted transcriptional regulator